MAIVILPFLYAGNGFTVEHLNAGDDREFGSATAGLVEAGLISIEVIPDSGDAVTPPAAPVIGSATAGRRGKK